MNTQFLKRPEGTIAYDDTGSGPLVVCAPSMGDVRGEYRFLAPQLVAAGYRVVTMDLRGLGESSTGWADYSVAGVGSDLVALITALDAGPAVIAGCSMAAGAAVWAAAEAPELVAGLVLLGPFVRGATSRQNRLLYSALFARPWGPGRLAALLLDPLPHAQTGRLRRVHGSAALESGTSGPAGGVAADAVRVQGGLGGAPASRVCACVGADGQQGSRFQAT